MKRPYLVLSSDHNIILTTKMEQLRTVRVSIRKIYKILYYPFLLRDKWIYFLYDDSQEYLKVFLVCSSSFDQWKILNNNKEKVATAGVSITNGKGFDICFYKNVLFCSCNFRFLLRLPDISLLNLK